MNPRRWWGVTREHVRAQARFTLTMGILMAVTLTLISLAALVGTTAQVRQDLYAEASGPSLEQATFVSYYTDGVPDLEYVSDYLHEPAEAARVLQAIMDQADRHALWGYALVPHPNVLYHLGLVGIDGDTRWDLILVEGVPPRDGEVVLSARAASDLNAQVGDTVTFAGDARIMNPAAEGGRELIHRAVTLSVSGISRIAAEGSGIYHTPDGYVSIDQAIELQQTYGLYSGRNEAGDETFLVEIAISWDGQVDPALVPEHWTTAPYVPSAFESLMDQGSGQAQAAGALGIVLGLVVVIAALAMARNRAAQRTQWVATARALGARRSQLMSAAVAEAGLLAVAAAVVGLGAAYAVHAAALAASRAAHPEVLDVAAPSVPGWLIGLIVAVAVVLAAAVSVAPALWAGRTSPVAALKPEPPAVQEPLRRIGWTRGTVLVVAGLAVAVTAERSLEAGRLHETFVFISLAAAGVGAFMVMLAVVQRTLSRVAAWLTKRGGAWAHTAADILRAKDLQSMVIAGCFMVLVVVLGVGHHLHLLDQIEHLPSVADYWDDTLMGLGSYTGIITAAFIAAGIGAAVGLSTVSATHADTATRTALGLTRNGISWARFSAHGAATAVGAAVGAVGSWAVLGVVLVINATVFDLHVESVGAGAQVMGLTMVAGLWASMIAVLVGLLGAALVGFIAVERAPMEELTRSY